MLSKRVIACTVLALLGYAAIAQAQGTAADVTVNFAQVDYREMEDRTMDVTVTVTSSEVIRNIQFQVEALTAQQYRDQAPSCQSGFSLPGDTDAEADLADLSVSRVTCSRVLGSSDFSCPFHVISDNILEAAEYLIFVLSVIDDAGHSITVDRNCANGVILFTSNQGFTLTAVTEQILVTEGNTTETFVYLDKNFQSDLPITITFSPRGLALIGNDYTSTLFNLDKLKVTFPANETRLEVPLIIVDDEIVEATEDLSIGFRADMGISVNPSIITISIVDNDVVTVGLNVSQPTITVAEGESITLCAAVTSPDLSDPAQRLFQRPGINMGLITTDQTAKDNEDFTGIRLSGNVFLEFGQSLCYTYEMTENNILERPRSFQVMVVDKTLAGITDPTERERYMALNVIQPSTVTISIEDNDGTPNKPTVTKVGSVKDLVFEWTIDDEDGLRPVDCYYGNITERVNSGTTDSLKETVHVFNFCGSSDPTAQEYAFKEYDSIKDYIIVVCTRNRLGESCSDPVTFPAPATPTHLPIITGATPPVTDPGLVAGIIVLVLALVFCCVLLFVILCLIYCCGWDRDRKYFPERREKKFGEYRHNAHNPNPADAFDTVGALEYDV